MSYASKANMDSQIIAKYRSIFEDLNLDWGESEELSQFVAALNPPPDKLVWLRATAFRIGCEFIQEGDDDEIKEKNVALLRAINAVVHTIETTCMKSANTDESGSFDGDKVEEFYNGIFSDLSVDAGENQNIYDFFKENPVPEEFLVKMRALAFKVGVNYLSDSKETTIQLFRCINVVVHAFEKFYMTPKSFELKLTCEVNLDMSLGDAVQHIWDLDVNRLKPDEDYVINVQGGKKPYWKEDAADDPLFQSVDRNALQRPTYKTFIALLDNYVAEAGVAENVTDAERSEIKQFLNAILQTGPMQFCHKYCHEKKPDLVPADLNGFKALLHKIWFELYSRKRGSRPDSSGFEHVFVGEVKNGKISGFHNWIQFYLEEQKGAVDYRGYIKPRGRGENEADGDDHILTLQFSWHGVEKFVGSSFIGVSPEFEMALYTMCFLVGEEKNDVDIDTGTDVFNMSITCYKMATDKIGTSFPEVTSHYDS